MAKLDPADHPDLIYELGDKNAPRTCSAECDQEAAYYLLCRGEYSTYRCRDHIPDEYFE